MKNTVVVQFFYAESFREYQIVTMKDWDLNH